MSCGDHLVNGNGNGNGNGCHAVAKTCCDGDAPAAPAGGGCCAGVSTSGNRLAEALARGPLLVAEGYVFELERRGYLQAGPFVPEVVLEHPKVLKQLHEDFVRAGSDVVLACTYYAHNEKLGVIGKEAQIDELNGQALRIAKEVAQEYGVMFAGDLSNTNLWKVSPEPELVERVRRMFDSQARWAADAGVDFIVGETFAFFGEAMLCLETIKKYNKPAVITLVVTTEEKTRDGVSYEEALQRLEAAGAAVVGYNCNRGPETMLPFLEKAVKAVKIPVAALPVAYRTSCSHPTFFQLACNHPDAETPWGRAFPVALDPYVCTRYEMAKFAERALKLGVQYIGGCCGTGPHHVRAMAEAMGRKPPSSKYSPDMSKHFAIGTDPKAAKPENKCFIVKQ